MNQFSDHIDSFLESKTIVSDTLEERSSMVGININSRDYLDCRVGFPNFIMKGGIVVVNILEDRLSFGISLKGIPARTNVMKFVGIFRGKFITIFVPRCKEDKFLEIGIVYGIY